MAGLGSATNAADAALALALPTRTPIKHLIVVVGENVTFDRGRRLLRLGAYPDARFLWRRAATAIVWRFSYAASMSGRSCCNFTAFQ